MWLDNASRDAVNMFWERCGAVEDFPRRLDRPIALALPIWVVKLPRLRLSAVESWLARRGVNFQFNCRDRALRGCLVARDGEGAMFVDGADPEDEQRFTLAQFAERHSAITSLLRRHFGLPEAIAATYGRSLLDAAGRGPSWVETLRLK